MRISEDRKRQNREIVLREIFEATRLADEDERANIPISSPERITNDAELIELMRRIEGLAQSEGLRREPSVLPIPDTVRRDIDSRGLESDMFYHDASRAVSEATFSTAGLVMNDGSGYLSGGNDIDGSVKFARTEVTADYAILLTDHILGIITTSLAITLTLLSAATVETGVVYHIKDESGNAFTNNITIDPDGTETIDGELTLVINVDYAAISIYSDGTNWFVF